MRIDPKVFIDAARKVDSAPLRSPVYLSDTLLGTEHKHDLWKLIGTEALRFNDPERKQAKLERVLTLCLAAAIAEDEND